MMCEGEQVVMAAELSPSHPPAAEVYNTPTPPPKTLINVWKSLLNWLLFFFHIFLQLLKLTPSLLTTRFLSFTDLLRHRFLLPSSSSPSFTPLPLVELSPPPLHSPPHLNLHATVAANNNNNNDYDDDDYQGIQKLTVVLDLDETLVSAYETSSLPATICDKAKEAGIICFELECVSMEMDFDGKPKVNHVTVFQRPGLKEFLKRTSEFADLVLFTAGLEGYAKPLVDRIDIENLFKLRFYRPSTSSTEYRDHVKDLSCISRDLSRTVIVDNNPFSFLLQPLNGIPCIPFTAGQPQDEQLLDVLLPLLRHLSTQEDVRPALYERFHMPEWFEKHGIPASYMTYNSTSQGN